MPKAAEHEHPLVERMRAEMIRNKGEWMRLSKLEHKRYGERQRFSYRWLHAFANGEMKSPGVIPVLALAEYLGMEIQVKPGAHFAKFKP